MSSGEAQTRQHSDSCLALKTDFNLRTLCFYSSKTLNESTCMIKKYGQASLGKTSSFEGKKRLGCHSIILKLAVALFFTTNKTLPTLSAGERVY